MDEKYYRELIDKVNQNEKGMWDGSDEPNDGYDDFNRLWGLLSDEEANLAPKTYFEAIDLCINSFYGTIQDQSYVWRNIASHYKQASKDKDSAFHKELETFLTDVQSSIPEMSVFYELMHLAIDTKNLQIAQKLLWMTPTEIESWVQIEEIYENEPELAAYLECLSDIHYDKFPNDPIFRETIKRIYYKFGNLPNMEKLKVDKFIS